MDSAQRYKDLLESDIDSATIEIDENGDARVIFTPEELAKVNAYLKSEGTRLYEDWSPIWTEAVENMETYRAVKIPIPDGGVSVYPAPIARIPADQIISSIFNAIMRTRPIFSIDAYLGAMYDVPGQPMDLPPQAEPGPVPTQQIGSEEIAQNMERGYEFIVRERIKLQEKLVKGVRGAVCGSPFWWKVVADPETRTSIAPRSNGVTVDLADKYMETRMRGDLVKWYLIPYTNAMMPLDAADPDSADYWWERTAWRPDELLAKHAAGKLFLLSAEKAEQLAKSTTAIFDPYRAKLAATTEKRDPQVPTQVCNTWMPWWYWTIRYTEPASETNPKPQKKIKRLSLLGDFHLDGGELMTCWINGYEHQCRPVELVDEREDGDSTVARMKYHQTISTYAAHAEIQSAFAANHLGYWHDPDNSVLADFFASHKMLGLGDHVPGIHGKEWGTYSSGEQLTHSLLELLKFVLSMSQLDSHENEFTMGGRPPGRTPATTVQQVYQHAEENKTMFLLRLSSKLSRLLRLDAETRRQYQPMGEVLPVWNDAARKTIEIPFRFPVGDVLDNFRIALTAADEALAQEHNPEQVMAKKKALMDDAEFIAKIVPAILNMTDPLPDEAVAMFAKMMKRDQRQLRRLIGLSDTNEDDYDLTPEINALVSTRNALMMQKKQAEATMGPQATQPQHGPQPGTPQQPQVKYNINLKADLTPSQEAAAALAAGAGGTDAQGQTSGSGAAPPGHPAGQPGGGSSATGGQPTVPPPAQQPAPPGGGIPPGQVVQ